MILQIQQAIEQNTLDVLLEALQDISFSNGKLSAGSAAQTVKNNQQAILTNGHPKALQMLLKHLEQQPLLQQAALPKTFTKVLLNQYQQGMEYGWHTDNALVNGKRCDISFSLGLTDTKDYQGGELVLQDHSGERAFKLGKGELLLYPSTYLHKVSPVTKGTRLALVGWIESFVKCPKKRELIFDLQQAASHEFTARGKTQQYDTLSKSHQNLLRMWSY